ncbi:hypothetical protein CC78DRAFT_621572, partial [Lojkania enalia]
CRATTNRVCLLLPLSPLCSGRKSIISQAKSHTHPEKPPSSPHSLRKTTSERPAPNPPEVHLHRRPPVTHGSSRGPALLTHGATPSTRDTHPHRISDRR